MQRNLNPHQCVFEIQDMEHAPLRLGDDAQVQAWDAMRLDSHVPRTLDRDTCEQDEQKGGRGDEGEECDEDVCVFVEFSVCRRYET